MLNTRIPGEAEVALPSPQISQGEHVGGRFLVHMEVTFPVANRPTSRARLKGNGCFYYLDFSFFSCDPKGGSSVHKQPLHAGIYVGPRGPLPSVSQTDTQNA